MSIKTSNDRTQRHVERWIETNQRTLHPTGFIKRPNIPRPHLQPLQHIPPILVLVRTGQDDQRLIDPMRISQPGPTCLVEGFGDVVSC